MKGTRLGPYQILGPLGAGGMGEVWLAQDERLGREVAIKVLPGAVAADPERLQRFEQEARASAALNHPHIAVVHDVGSETDESGEAVHYMVQEYLQGETLRDRLDRGPIPPREAAELGRQIAGALAAAHAEGIVHRDLKPDNLFLVSPDHVKVLDFGLAKLTESASVGPVDATMSPTYVGTTVGQLLGTAGYMAPEQVRGESVDHRADLFAFGCVFHEMLTGRRAFAGRTVHQTLDIILNDEPAPPDDATPAPPQQLDWIRRKCLAKEPGRRYQHADELAVDLTRFTDDLASGAIDPGTASAAPARSEEPGTRRRGLAATLLSWPVLAAVALTALVASLITWELLPSGEASRPEPERITDFSTWAGSPAISPDGRLLAFVAEEPQSVDSQIWVKTLPDGPPLQLTDTPGAKDMPAFSPDGSRIAYTVMGDEWQWDTWIVPIVGGEPRLMLRNANSLTWTPDGRVIYSEYRQGSQLAIVTSDESGADKRDVWVPRLNQMAHFSDVSPDGERVLIAYMGEGPYSDDALACFVRDLDDPDAEVLMVGEGDPGCRFFARYSPDGEWIYFRSQGGIWRQPAGGGELEQVYAGADLGASGGWVPFALEPDGEGLLLSLGTESRDLWVQSPDGRQRQITYAGSVSEPTFSADGRYLYYVGAGRRGAGPVWRHQMETGRREQVCLGRDADAVTVSPDGRTALLTEGDFDGTTIWVCTLDGSEPIRQLIDPDAGPELPDRELVVWNPVFSADGESVYFGALVGGGRTDVELWRVGLDGSGLEAISESIPWAEVVSASPDGEWLSVSSQAQSPRQTWLYPTDGGEPRLLLRGWDLYWAPNGSSWMFHNGGMIATTWVLKNPDGLLLPEDMPEYPTGVWFESVDARKVLVGGGFSTPAISPTPYLIAFDHNQERSNLHRLPLPE